MAPAPPGAGRSHRARIRFMDYRDSSSTNRRTSEASEQKSKDLSIPATIQTARSHLRLLILMPMDHGHFPAEGTVVCTLLELARDFSGFYRW